MVNVKYQVFVDSIHGSDVLDFDELDDARKAAKEWKKELSKKDDNRVIIIKVTEEIVDEI